MLLDCGSVTPDSITGLAVLPPDLGDPVSVHHFEVPVASIQGANAVRLRIDFTAAGDADIYLQAPGTTPGSICYGEYIFQDISGGATDWIRIRNSGLDVSNGNTSTAATLADYKAASTNLAFVIVGWTDTAYDISIICN